MSTTTTMLYPMPIPGTPNAPLYKGEFTRDFLDALVDHGRNAGITNKDNLVDYIVRYSDSVVKLQIRFLPEFDRDVTTKTWKEAEAMLKELYGHRDKPRTVSLEEFQRWVQSSADNRTFGSKDDVITYYSDYLRIASPLKKNGVLSDNQFKFFFVQGVPTGLKEWFRDNIPEVNRSRTNPLEIIKALEILKNRYNEDDITYEAWRHASNQENIPTTGQNSNAYGNSQAPPRAGAGTEDRQTYNQQTNRPANPMENAIDDLAKQMQRMQLHLAQLGNTPEGRRNPNYPPVGTPLRCWICGIVTADHRPGPKRCPATAPLVTEGFIKYDPATDNYVMADGSSLPFVPNGFMGGLADYLRTTRTPPSTRSQESSSHTVGIIYEGDDNVVLGNGIFGIASLTGQSNPSLRSGKDTSHRFDPLRRPDKTQENGTPPRAPVGNIPETVPQAQPLPPVVTKTVPPPAKGKNVDVPTPPNPINRRDGYKQSQPHRGRDIEMTDATKERNLYQPQYKFQSKVSARVNAKEVFEAIKGQLQVTLPYHDLLGLSRDLERLENEETDRKRVPPQNNKSVHFGNIEIVTTGYGTTGENPFTDSELQVDMPLEREEKDSFEVFVHKIAGGFTGSERQLYAMVTGVFNIKFGDMTFRAMIDTGSELNIMSSTVPERARLPIDFEGRRWLLKGIHGSPERLNGCCIDAPITIGTHTFRHHVFVSRQEEIGDSFDMILGQPFLAWFSARLQYHKDGEVVMLLWKDGDGGDGRVSPTLGITITHPDDSRNKMEILPQAPRPMSQTYYPLTQSGHQRASIEEVSDTEDF